MSVIAVLRKAPTLVLIVSSLTLNAALVGKVVRQQQTIKGLTPQPVLKPGHEIGEISGTTLEGRPTSVPPADRNGSLIYVYSSTCGWCERNGANMREVFRAARAKGLQVWALALDKKGAREFLAGHGVEASEAAIVVPSQESRDRYSLGGTPQTLVIGADHRLIKNWRGAWTRSAATDVEKYFGITLPGLTEAPPAKEVVRQ